MDATVVLTLASAGALTQRPPTTSADVDWSNAPPVTGAKAWYWDPSTSTWFTENTDDEPNWRKWPRDNVLGFVVYHRKPDKPTLDYRTFVYGYDFVRVPGMPGNLAAFEGVWIDDTNWADVMAEMHSDAWRPA